MTWSLQGSLAGEVGLKGATGDTGATGATGDRGPGDIRHSSLRGSTSATQTLTANTWTNLATPNLLSSSGSVEGNIDSTTTGRFTVRQTGMYLILGGVRGGGDVEINLRAQVNGTDSLGLTAGYNNMRGTQDPSAEFCSPRYLNANDYVQFSVRATGNITLAAANIHAGVSRLGPA